MAKETEEMEINQIMEVEDPIDVVKLDLFEDDDEFEDFEFDLECDKDVSPLQLWENNWDDDDVDDDFSLQLRRELS
ncbi:hypothetical protein ZOSMA_54G00540 [Zostera marina]|uniref:26S proteasome complex subunit SEM1 n=1 Tax=Zostera marina TaxID=29655 RepID=A0A0K9NWV9_ZOSMR|nr:hypothetical protein ZOSMA_54G00540 [Zostera marina]